jgi:hypothetical protein
VSTTQPAVFTCLICRRIVPTRLAPSGAIRLQRHTADALLDAATGHACPGTGKVIAP